MPNANTGVTLHYKIPLLQQPLYNLMHLFTFARQALDSLLLSLVFSQRKHTRLVQNVNHSFEFGSLLVSLIFKAALLERETIAPRQQKLFTSLPLNISQPYIQADAELWAEVLTAVARSRWLSISIPMDETASSSSSLLVLMSPDPSWWLQKQLRCTSSVLMGHATQEVSNLGGRTLTIAATLVSSPEGSASSCGGAWAITGGFCHN